MSSVTSQIHRLVIVLITSAIRGYQFCLSPLLPRSCRFWPSCSEYSIQSFKRFGILKGTSLSVLRLLRCHPFHQGGHDPVPPKPIVESQRKHGL